MGKIKAIIKRADRPDAYATHISNTLKNLQQLVGGYIETVTITTDLVIVCNEEGRIRGLPYNCTIGGCPFYGDILFLGVKGEDFSDAPFESLDEFRQYFRRSIQ